MNKLKQKVVSIVTSMTMSLALIGGVVPPSFLMGRAAEAPKMQAVPEDSERTPVVLNSEGSKEDAFAPEKWHQLLSDSEKPRYFDLRHVNENGKEVSYITKVKEQNPFGTCWGFAAIAAAESDLLSSGLAEKRGYNSDTLDLSEKQIAWFVTKEMNEEGNSQNGEGAVFREGTPENLRYDAGGGLMFATNMFATGVGPTFEDTDTEDGEIYRYQGRNGEVFTKDVTWIDEAGKEHSGLRRVYYSDEDDWSIPDKYRFHQDFTLRESFIIPDPTTDKGSTYHPEATEAIKEQLLKKHAVSIDYMSTHSVAGEEINEDDVMSSNWAQFSDDISQNHVVTVVGYDDDYPRSNFIKGKEPPADGAWLVKNSWGSDTGTFPNNSYSHWGLLEGQDIPGSDYKAVSGRHTGYFWLSYYDHSIANCEAYSFMECVDDEKVNQYDYMPVYDYQEYADESENKMANVFTASRSEKLTDISVFTSTPGTKVSYKIYLLPADAAGPEDGQCVVSSVEKEYPLGGYHRESLAKKDQVYLCKGQKYSVVITSRTPSGKYSVVFGKSPLSPRLGSDPRSFRSVVNPGESYLFLNGTWKDFSDENVVNPILELEKMNPEYFEACADNFPIKAFTVPGEADGASLVVVNKNRVTVDRQELSTGGSQELEAMLKGAKEELLDMNPEFSWTSTNPDVFTVEKDKKNEYKALIKAIRPGTADLVVDAGIFGKRIIRVKVNKLQILRAELIETESIALPEMTYTGEPLIMKPEIVSGEQMGSDESRQLKEGEDYTLSYKENVKCGRAYVLVKGIGEYEGTVENNSFMDNLVYVIVPAKAAVKKITPGKNRLQVEFESQKDSGISGYELSWRESGTSEWKTMKVNDASAASADITGLTVGAAYEVRLRAYVTTLDSRGSYDAEYDVYEDGDVDHFGQYSDVVVSGKVTDTDSAEGSASPSGSGNTPSGNNPSGNNTSGNNTSGNASKKVNTMKVKVSAKTFKRAKLTKKKTFSLGVTKAQGKVTYTLDAKAKKAKIKVSSKGKVAVPKKCKKGTYRITVKAAGNSQYKALSKKVTIKVQ